MVAPYSAAMLAMVARSGSRQMLHRRTAEFDHRREHVGTAQKSGQREHDVGAHHAGARRADEAAADDARHRQADRLPEHRGRRLDAADAPAEHAEPVDHRRVAVHPDEAVGKREPAAVPLGAGDDLRQVLDVDLMDDAVARRHHAQIVELRHRPLHDAEPLAVALQLRVEVARERIGRAGEVDANRMVDHEIGRYHRIDASRVEAARRHRVAQSGEIDQQRNAGGIRHQHPERMESHLAAERRRVGPARQRGDVVLA